MDDDAVSSRPHLIRVAWVSTTGWIVEPYTTNTKWRMVDIHLERRHFTNQPIVIIVPTYYGGLLDKATSVKVLHSPPSQITGLKNHRKTI